MELIFNNISLIVYFLAGAVGALVSDILKDNSLELPKKIDGKLCLGFMGGVIVGGFAGLLIDGSVTTAFMGGYMGKEIVIKLIKK